MLSSNQVGALALASAVGMLTFGAGAQNGDVRVFAAPPPELPAQPIELSAPPMYAAASAGVSTVGGRGGEPVLVPLPPGVWAAASGLVGLAVVAVWRKHRLREQ